MATNAGIKLSSDIGAATGYKGLAAPFD